MTPHISAKKEEVADIVIMPGDPKRAKFIAENFLDNPVLVSDVRCAYLYTGNYKNKRVSVMASGMGMPSIGIYSYELFKFYDVKNIIRLGSCKTLKAEIDVSDIIVATSACTVSNFSYSASGQLINEISSSEYLNDKIIKASNELGIKVFTGLINTTDIFYSFDDFDSINENAVGLEMETFGLLYNAKKLGKEATSVLTVSDSDFKELSSEEREKSFTKAMKLVLESIIK